MAKTSTGTGTRVGFETVTVRAAARLVKMRQQGELTRAEFEYYLVELADLDQIARGKNSQLLARMAHEYAMRGRQRAAQSRTLQGTVVRTG